MQLRKKCYIIILLTAAFLLLTRTLTISHNMYLHCDEHVFFTAAQSLKGYLSGSSPVYEEVKEYPEGAIVLQLPFHILTAILNRLTGAAISPQLSGRIAAVFYFTAGAVLGCITVIRFFSKKPLTLAVYGLILTFSIMHIEQSRYGTGDAISLFLLLAVVLFTSLALSSQAHALHWILTSFVVCGMLTAVKYPLIFFLILPVYGLCTLLRGRSAPKKACLVFLALFLLYFGFAMISPKAAFHPSYIFRASTRELGAYLSSGSSRLALLWANTMAVLVYSTFYSGFPFMPVFLFLAFRRRWKLASRQDALSLLLNRILPVLITVFFLYNLSVSILAMRTYYPFFFLGDLYVADEIGELLSAKTGKKAVSITLLGVMVFRGAYLISLMTDQSDSARMAQLISSAVDQNWNKTTVLSGQLIFPDGYQDYINTQVITFSDERFTNANTMELAQGELFIAGAQSHTSGAFQFRFLPFRMDPYPDAKTYLEFEQINSPYYIGRLYPEYYYYLFGSWIYGATGNGAEFPRCTVYYRS